MLSATAHPLAWSLLCPPITAWPHASFPAPVSCLIGTEDFEVWAINRLRACPGEIESSIVWNRLYDDLRAVAALQCKKYLLRNSNSVMSVNRDAERCKDHASQFVLRLVFCCS